MSTPSTLRIAGDLTPDLLAQVRAGLGEPGDWDATVVAALVAKLDDYRARLAAAESDLLNVRGILSPNGHPRRVPMELVPTIAPAVEWLVGEVERLREQAVADEDAENAASCAQDTRIRELEQENALLRAARDGTDRHFSPGYEGEIPNHLGAFETCPMPACVTSRRQHEAAADIQQITSEMFADNARGGA